MWSAIALVRAGLLTNAEFVACVEHQLQSRHSIGRLALERNKLTLRQAKEVLLLQADTPRPFGRIAVDSGYLNEEELAQLLALQNARLKPLEEIAADQGFIDRETMHQELAAAQREAARSLEACTTG